MVTIIEFTSSQGRFTRLYLMNITEAEKRIKQIYGNVTVHQIYTTSQKTFLNNSCVSRK